MNKHVRRKPTIVRAQVVDATTGLSATQAVRLESLKDSPVRRHASLTPELAERADAVWRRVAHWLGTDKAGFLEGLLKDQNPDKEIAIWEQIGRVVDEMWDHELSRALNRPQLVRAVLGVSMGVVDLPSQVPGVTDELVAAVRKQYGLD